MIGEADGICFTGSVATGQKVAAACAAQLIPAFLELGGKDPVIVLASADRTGLRPSLRASAQATGQPASRWNASMWMHNSKEFVTRLVARAKAVQLNWPDSRSGQVGPLIFASQAEIIATHLVDAVQKARVSETGGVIERHGGGYWLRPTVVGVTHDMLLMTEETFGPVLPVMSFSDVPEAVRLANDSAYGFVSSRIRR